MNIAQLGLVSEGAADAGLLFRTPVPLEPIVPSYSGVRAQDLLFSWRLGVAELSHW